MTEYATVGGNSGGTDGVNTRDRASTDRNLEGLLDSLDRLAGEIGVDVRAGVVCQDNVTGSVDAPG